VTAELHTIRLTELEPVDTNYEFVQSALGHDESTNELVKDIDTIVHIAETPPGLKGQAEEPENYEIDFQTRCTYNLLMAASEEGVKHFIYASTLRLFEQHGKDWTVKENWRPRPSIEGFVLAKHLGEFTCREFARERKIKVTCLRLGEIITAEEAADTEFNAMWLEINDAVAAFQGAIDAPSRWGIFHVQSEFPGSRFDIGPAKEHLKFNPQFVPTTQ
ncbi:NAD(P)-dependent oxidoreductase, partial [Candidatus Poribacteria bacterium]|nr:NAD(P)-dependent oxidoreductase [Candidatus Poribacteria bacterium]